MTYIVWILINLNSTFYFKFNSVLNIAKLAKSNSVENKHNQQPFTFSIQVITEPLYS